MINNIKNVFNYPFRQEFRCYDLSGYNVVTKDEDYIPLYAVQSFYEILKIDEKLNIVYCLPDGIVFSVPIKAQRLFFNCEPPYISYLLKLKFGQHEFYSFNRSIVFKKDMVACILMIKLKDVKAKNIKNVELWIDEDIILKSEFRIFKEKLFHYEARYEEVGVQVKMVKNLKTKVFPYNFASNFEYHTLEHEERAKKELLENIKYIT